MIKKRKDKGKIDWMITLVPLMLVVGLSILFFLMPEQSNAVLSRIRFFFGDTFGIYYLIIGLGILMLSFILHFRGLEISYWESRMKSQSILFSHGEQ